MDDAFYSMIASHFPSLESLKHDAQPGTHAVYGRAAETATAPFDLSVHNHVIAAGSSKQALANQQPDLRNNNNDNNNTIGHSHTGSLAYYPQPTRSGRVPVPPPEEELQAMLAMDNYFEFPSESESDDEDFVLPNSEGNDEDEDMCEETPQAGDEEVLTTNSVEIEDPEARHAHVIDSNEYDWLMENLRTVEASTSKPSTSVPVSSLPHRPQSSVFSHHLPKKMRQTESPPPLSSKDSSLASHSSLGKDSSPSEVPTMQRQTLNVPKLSQTRTVYIAKPQIADRETRSRSRRSNTVKNSTAPPAPSTSVQSHKEVSPTSANQSTPSAQPRNPAGHVKRPLSQIEGSQTSSLSQAEVKRLKNAEHSRTFRDRQKALKEVTADRLDHLEEENDRLRQELEGVKARLEYLEDMLKASSRSSKTVSSACETDSHNCLADASKAPILSEDKEEQTVLPYEALGKLVASLVQSNGRTLTACNPNSMPQNRPTSPLYADENSYAKGSS